MKSSRNSISKLTESLLLLNRSVFAARLTGSYPSNVEDRMRRRSRFWDVALEHIDPPVVVF